jgi:hypothetical protein
MPVLDNPRWERFAQLIVSYVHKPGEPNSKGKLYSQSGYRAKDVGQDGGSAEVCAARLLKQVQVRNRVQELLQEAQDKATSKRAYDIDTITERIGIASKIAEEDRNPSALTNAEKAIAEVRGLVVQKHETTVKTNTETSDQIALAFRRLRTRRRAQR